MNCLYSVVISSFLVPISCVRACWQDVQAGLGLNVYIILMLLQRHSSIIYYSTDCMKLVLVELE